MQWLNLLINLILPPRCIKCGKILNEHNGLCSDCFNKIQFISAPYCAHCGRPFLNESGLSAGKKQLCGKCLQEKRRLFELQRSAFVYDDESKNSGIKPFMQKLWQIYCSAQAATFGENSRICCCQCLFIS